MTSATNPEFVVTPLDEIAGIVAGARAAFDTGRTRSVAGREALLRRLRDLLLAHEDALYDALHADLRKPRLEAFASEVGFVLGEIDHVLAHLADWARPRRVATPVSGLPGSSRVEPQPLGVVCVIAPWNYPAQLLLAPVVAAIAAGDAVVAKPSELAPATSAVLAGLIAELADPGVVCVQGGVAETTELLAQRFDHIFYTGNGRVARVVMRAAAEHLTPVVLELGGKSPAIVTARADIEVAARRIAWGKFLNAGQTCIAPDYVLVERSVHDQLVAALGRCIEEFYGPDPQRSPDLARIVNDAHFHRLEKFLACGEVAYGGIADVDDRYIAPTVLTGITRQDPVMQEEIFGPVLPVLAFDGLGDAIEFVIADDKPLALYVFSQDGAEVDRVLERTSSGGACVNGTLFQVTNPNLPFGGVGESGTGSYHGRAGFDALSHHRAVHERSTRVDPPMLYPPYTDKKAGLVRRGLMLGDPREALAKARNRLRRRS